MAQGAEYNVDLVMCIDGTGSMGKCIDQVKAKALTFSDMFRDAMEEADKTVDKLRVKVIVFRDYGVDAEPMTESKFFTLPDDSVEFSSFVNDIEPSGGGDAPENSLEAIATALKSDWATDGFKQRHAVLMFTDAPALELGARASSPNYPKDLPTDLAGLSAWWHGTDQTLTSTYRVKAGRLFIFAPNAEPWSSIQTWQRNWTIYSEAGKGLSDMDLENVIAVMVGSF